MKNIQKYMIEAITGAFLLLYLFWTIGYFANALYGMKFDIRSCWDGFTTLGGAGVLAMVKYIMDSWNIVKISRINKKSQRQPSAKVLALCR